MGKLILSILSLIIFFSAFVMDDKNPTSTKLMILGMFLMIIATTI